MPRRPATESQREEVRQKIRNAAKAIYREKGITGISARAIAVSAGVSVGTIYSYFGDLQTLMQSLWLEPLDRFPRPVGIPDSTHNFNVCITLQNFFEHTSHQRGIVCNEHPYFIVCTNHQYYASTRTFVPH